MYTRHLQKFPAGLFLQACLIPRLMTEKQRQVDETYDRPGESSPDQDCCWQTVSDVSSQSEWYNVIWWLLKNLWLLTWLAK